MFKITYNGKWQIVRPGTDLTENSAEELRLLFLELLEKKKKFIRFDFSGVNDIHAKSFMIFVMFSKIAVQQYPDMRVELINPEKKIADLFEMTRLDEFYKIPHKDNNQ